MEDVTAASVLGAFRARELERPECVHPLLRDPVLRNLVVVWNLSAVQLGPPDGSPPEGDAARWEWLWRSAVYDRDALANALRVDRMKVGRLVARASAFRLIYPDGTVNQLAIQFVRGEILKDMGGKRRGRDEAPERAAPPATSAVAGR